MDLKDRRHFDNLLESIIEALPDDIRERLEEVPVVVEDQPSARELADLGIEGRGTLLCGLHSGIPLTSRSVEHSGAIPDRIMLYRQPIIAVSRFRRGGSLRDLERQVRITLLHEIGHHFGLDEDDLAELGYA